MIRISELKLPLSTLPEDSSTQPVEALRAQAAQMLGIAPTDIATLHVHKRSFDARKPELLTVYIVDLTLQDASAEAALLAQMGFKPIVLERGKTVRERTKDTWGLWRKKVLNPESNVQFGEGGAGTF